MRERRLTLAERVVLALLGVLERLSERLSERGWRRHYRRQR